jgi:hypothetical protein
MCSNVFYPAYASGVSSFESVPAMSCRLKRPLCAVFLFLHRRSAKRREKKSVDAAIQIPVDRYHRVQQYCTGSYTITFNTRISHHRQKMTATLPQII